MYIAAGALLAVITVLAGITAVHAQTDGAIMANDDTAVSNGIDELAIDILANDIFEGPVSVTVESRHVWPHIIQGLGSAEYNGTHLVYTPGEWAPILIAWDEPYAPGVPYSQTRNTTEVPYTYTIQDSMNRQTSANVTIHITNPVARAVVSDAESDPKFFVIGYSNDPISGRLLDADGNIIYNFTGIRSSANWFETRIADQFYDLVPDPEYFTFIDYGYRILYYPMITAVAPEFDPPLEPGTYTYQFARAADTDYAGDDVHAGSFTVPEPSEQATKIVNRDLSNRDPVAKSIRERAVTDGIVAIPLPVHDPDGDDLTITRVYGNILGTTFDVYPQLGRIVYLAGSYPGVDILYYAASDGRGGSATGKIIVVVEGSSPPVEPYDPSNVPPDETSNRPPVAMDMQVFAVLDISVVIFPNAVDPDGDHLFITNRTGATLGTIYESAFVTINSHHILYTPNQTGTDTITYTVSDGRGGTDSNTITIYIREQNDTMPVPEDIADTDVLEAYMPHGLVVHADVMEDPGDDAGMMLSDAARQASHDPAPGFLLAGIITNATDTAGSAGRDIAGQNDITVSVIETGNVPPALSPIGDYTINAHDTLVIRVQAIDYGGGTILYMLSGAPDGAKISGQGVFSWTPAANDAGTHAFTIAAYDLHGAATTEPVTVTVLPAETPNGPPDAPDIAAAVAPGGRVIIVPAISDPDDDQVRITRVTADAGGAIMPSDNSIEYTAGTSTGIETVTYTVRDSRGATATGTITVTIR